MALEDLERLLLAAAKISNHRRFIVAGSLSVIGAVMRPPRAMAMSRDLDFYPQLDPGRGFVEIASQLGHDSVFHQENGYYADPITPQLLALPDGWENRLAPISLSGVVAIFLDPNDVAVGKLARSHENDVLWVKSGIAEGILSEETILQRLASVPALSVDETARARDSLQAILQPPAPEPQRLEPPGA